MTATSDIARYDLIAIISDDYKVLVGIRPRYVDWDSMSTEELQSWHDEIRESIGLKMEMDQRDELEEELVVEVATDTQVGSGWLKNTVL